MPSELTLLEYYPPSSATILSRDHKVIEEYSKEKRTVVPLSKIPLIVKGAFLIAEDKEFYRHGGISYSGVFRAIIENSIKNIWNKKPAGGSTITQQIAKNLLVGSSKTFSRKIKEAIMAFRIESSLTKDKILEIYLNQLYLGKGCYGVAAASKYYFNKKISQLLPEEVAFLASIPSAPQIYSNMHNVKRLNVKMNTILYQLYEMGYITKHQLNRAINSEIKLRIPEHKNIAPYFSDEIFREISACVSKEAFFQCGYQIITTLHPKIQQCATLSLENGLINLQKKLGWKPQKFANTDLKQIYKSLPPTINKILPCKIIESNNEVLVGKDKDLNTITIQRGEYRDAHVDNGDIVLCRELENNTFELYQQPEMTGGIVVMDANSGEVFALCGGFNFEISKFNCMTQGKRQPGSAIKPFVYACAFEAGMDEHDSISDRPVNIRMSNGSIYSPKNFDNKSLGDIELRDGLIRSRNQATINLALKLGMSNIRPVLQKAGLLQSRAPISSVLGSVELSPLSLITAYSIFFNEGILIQPHFIKTITQYNSKFASVNLLRPLLQKKNRQVISAYSANIIKNILHDVVAQGTAANLGELEERFGVELYGKTGTTNESKDAWFIGAISKNGQSVLIGIFVGYETPKSLGAKAWGSTIALPIFRDLIQMLFT